MKTRHQSKSAFPLLTLTISFNCHIMLSVVLCNETKVYLNIVIYWYNLTNNLSDIIAIAMSWLNTWRQWCFLISLVELIGGSARVWWNAGGRGGEGADRVWFWKGTHVKWNSLFSENIPSEIIFFYISSYYLKCEQKPNAKMKI